MLQGPYGTLDRDRPLIRLSIVGFMVGTVLLPLLGLVVCLIVSLMYHFEEATYTHCKVTNYLPSISAAISRVPERYIWRCCIGLHSTPRFFMSVVYFNFYRSRFSNKPVELVLSVLVLICNLAENSGLLLLTYVSSTETYVVHKNGFIAFIISSLLHMLGTCRLWQVIQRVHINSEEVRSYKWKVRLFIFNISCCAAAAYFFRRHNKFCEEGVYTFFALCEYLVVLSNMAFHTTASWDFGSKELTVATQPEDKRY